MDNGWDGPLVILAYGLISYLVIRSLIDSNERSTASRPFVYFENADKVSETYGRHPGWIWQACVLFMILTDSVCAFFRKSLYGVIGFIMSGFVVVICAVYSWGIPEFIEAICSLLEWLVKLAGKNPPLP